MTDRAITDPCHTVHETSHNFGGSLPTDVIFVLRFESEQQYRRPSTPSLIILGNLLHKSEHSSGLTVEPQRP
jgi:hypothetical protein